MFAENLKNTRQQKGMTQEELAIRLHVVRQTVSKWEKGLSVPDAEMLIKIGELFEIPVSELLGAKAETEPDSNEIAEQLSRINEQLAVKNRRTKFVVRVILGIIVGIIVLNICLILLGVISYDRYKEKTDIAITEEIVTDIP